MSSSTSGLMSRTWCQGLPHEPALPSGVLGQGRGVSFPAGHLQPPGPSCIITQHHKDKEAILHMLRNIPVPKLRGLCFSSAEVQRWRARMFLLRLSAKAAALAHTSSTPHLQPCLRCPLLPEE